MNVLEQIYAKAKENPQKVAFPEASNEKMMQAAYETGKEGYIIPVLVGEAEKLKELAEERGYDPSVFSFVDIHDETYTNDVIRFRNLAIRNAWFSGGVEWNCGIIGHSPFTCSAMYCAKAVSYTHLTLPTIA